MSDYKNEVSCCLGRQEKCLEFIKTAMAPSSGWTRAVMRHILPFTT